MIYLVLYDEFGNYQRVATANNDRELQQFLDAGFIEVEQSEYERCAAIVEDTRLSDLAGLLAALSALNAIRRAGSGTQPPAPETIDREQIERLINTFARNSKKRTEQLFAGDIDSEQWFNAMAAQIKRNRLAARAVGVGGFQNLTLDDLQAASAATRDELAYLTEFRKQIDAGTVSEKQAIARAAMYGGGAREQAEQAHQVALGLPSRNGRSLLPVQPGVRTQCRKNCKCRWEIVQLSPGNFDCYWRRSPVDSCDTCIVRERRFNPLGIRNGVVQPYSTSGIYAP